jgi:hypothetical protein
MNSPFILMSLFLPELLDLDLLLSFLHGTCIGHKSRSLTSSWTTSQFLVPRKAFHHFTPFQELLLSLSEHVVAVAPKLIELISLAHLHPENDARNQAVFAVKSLLDRTFKRADRNRTMFFAAQVISDFEEFWENPFFGSVHSVHKGSGSSWFLGAYRRGLPPVEKKSEVMTDTMICENIVRDLHECSALELACLGYDYPVDDGRVRNRLNIA